MEVAEVDRLEAERYEISLKTSWMLVEAIIPLNEEELREIWTALRDNGDVWGIRAFRKIDVAARLMGRDFLVK